MKRSINKNDIVVLVHGLGGGRLDMWPLARQLKRRGYQVHQWTYRSFGNRIQKHADRFANDLVTLSADITLDRIHLVTHSMGGIIARAMLANNTIENLGRVVMLAPPHGGSHTARKLAPYLGWLTPSLLQLSDGEDSFVNRLPNSFKAQGIEFGIIEATKDRVIAQGAVLLEGYCDYARVTGHHGVLAWYPQTIELTENFLAHGRFEHSDWPPPT